MPSSDVVVRAVSDAFERFNNTVAAHDKTDYGQYLLAIVTSAQTLTSDLVEIDGVLNTPAVGACILNIETRISFCPMDFGVGHELLFGLCSGAYLGAVMSFSRFAEKLRSNALSKVAASEEIHLAKINDISNAIRELRQDVEQCKQADLFTNRFQALTRSVEKFGDRLSCDEELLTAEEGIDWAKSSVQHEVKEMIENVISCFSQVERELFVIGLASGFPTGIGVFMRTWILSYHRGFIPFSN